MAVLLSSGMQGLQGWVMLVELMPEEASPPRCNPCTGKGNDAGLKKACMGFISYNPNDVVWIALLCR